MPSIRNLEDGIRKGTKEDIGMEKSYKEWFLRKVIFLSFIDISKLFSITFKMIESES